MRYFFFLIFFFVLSAGKVQGGDHFLTQFDPESIADASIQLGEPLWRENILKRRPYCRWSPLPLAIYEQRVNQILKAKELGSFSSSAFTDPLLHGKYAEK